MPLTLTLLPSRNACSVTVWSLDILTTILTKNIINIPLIHLFTFPSSAWRFKLELSNIKTSYILLNNRIPISTVLSASCENETSNHTWRQNVRASFGRLWAFCWRYVCRRLCTVCCAFLSINLAIFVKWAKRNCSGNHSMFPTKVTAGIWKPWRIHNCFSSLADDANVTEQQAAPFSAPNWVRWGHT